MILKGQLAEARHRLKELELRADSEVLLLRMRALPTLKLLDYRTDEIVAAATALRDAQRQAREQQKLIDQIAEALGG